MYAPMRHNLLSLRKTVTYRFTSLPAHSTRRVVHRQYRTLFTSSMGTARLRHQIASSASSAFWNLHIRAVSYSSIPKSVARALKVLVACVVVGAIVISYVKYKIKELRKKTIGGIEDLFNSVSGELKSVQARLSEVRLPHVDTPQFLKNLFAPVSSVGADNSNNTNSSSSINDKVEESCKKTGGLVTTLQDAASGLLGSASDKLKSSQVRLPEVKLPHVDTPQFLKDLFAPVSGGEAGNSNDTNSSSSINDKVEESCKKTNGLVTTLQDAASGLLGSASDRLKSSQVRLPEVKLPHVDTPQFLKDLFAPVSSGGADNSNNTNSSSSTTDLNVEELCKKTNGLVTTPQDAASVLLGSASDKLKSSQVCLPEVKLSHVDSPQSFKDLSSPASSGVADNTSGSPSKEGGNQKCSPEHGDK